MLASLNQFLFYFYRPHIDISLITEVVTLYGNIFNYYPFYDRYLLEDDGKQFWQNGEPVSTVKQEFALFVCLTLPYLLRVIK